MASKKKAVKKTDKQELILELKDALTETYNLPLERTPELDQFTLDMLWSYYETPGKHNKVCEVIRHALAACGVCDELPKSDEYDGELADIVEKWQGEAKFGWRSWQKLLG